MRSFHVESTTVVVIFFLVRQNFYQNSFSEMKFILLEFSMIERKKCRSKVQCFVRKNSMDREKKNVMNNVIELSFRIQKKIGGARLSTNENK